jgi:ADP-ribosylglycohydrolase
MDNELEKSIISCILGTAVGDSLGLPYEALSKKRQSKLFPDINRHHFIFGKGMISDDTEHTLMVCESLLKTGQDVESFIQDLSWRFRFWMLGLPAGVGLATLKACGKLLFGFSGKNSGVFSAGNGPAMRAAVIGVLCREKPALMKELVRASTIITHTDPKAFHGALAVALAAAENSRNIYGKEEIDFNKYYDALTSLSDPGSEEFLNLVKKSWDSFQNGDTTEEFAIKLGLKKGVSGYVFHTVPVVLHAWFKYPLSFKEALQSVILCGGDTDTTGAIIGAVVGAGVGEEGIPKEWIENVWEWPRNVEWMRELGIRLAKNTLIENSADVEVANKGEDKNEKNFEIPPYNKFLILPRNLIFMGIVLAHGFRRMLPI